MTKLEIACVIIGFISFLFQTDTKLNVKGKTSVVFAMIQIIVGYLISFAMIILPLYFRLWRK